MSNESAHMQAGLQANEHHTSCCCMGIEHSYSSSMYQILLQARL